MVRPLHQALRGLVGLVGLVAGPAAAEPGPAERTAPPAEVAAPPVEHAAPAAGPLVRRRTATVREVMRGPFSSSRLFAMPTADVVGAYILSMSGEGSLLQQTGLLTSAGALAVGFGDIAQLEYRHTSAISIDAVNAPLPAVGVQLKLPLPDRSWVPALGVAFRLGVPREQGVAGSTITETVTDLYLVGRLRFDGAPWLRLHGGTRISSAKVELAGAESADEPVTRTLVLPTGGWELQMNPTAKLVGEIALAPQFRWEAGMAMVPVIDYGLLGRLGLRWSVLPALVIDGSIGYQLEVTNTAPALGLDAVVQWDIRLGAEVFVPWGALACRATGAFCD